MLKRCGALFDKETASALLGIRIFLPDRPDVVFQIIKTRCVKLSHIPQIV
jgi:hypothetical protein